MKEIFTKIWKFLWERTGRKELDSDEIWLLERMDRIAAIEEPDYDRMWERIRRKTICKNSPRVKLWREWLRWHCLWLSFVQQFIFSGKKRNNRPGNF
jgi:hypothetical protein